MSDSSIAPPIINLKSSRSYPLPAEQEAIAPDLLDRAAEAGMDPKLFGDGVMDFMTGGVTAEQLAANRKAKLSSGGIAGLGLKE